MKNFILFFTLFFSSVFINTSKANISLEMFLMRKGVEVNIVIVSTGSEMPVEIFIERKSSLVLSRYRKILTLKQEDIAELQKNGKIILKDKYPESRQLETYYRLKYTTHGGVLKTPPAVFLNKATSEVAVTFGGNKEEASMFETEEEKDLPTYQEYGFILSVKRVGTNVLLTITGGANYMEYYWIIERKTAKPLSSFRKMKTINKEEKLLTASGEHVFLDKYPESRKLDAYYRLVLIDKEGEKIEFPSVLLYKDASR